jgi:CelD/BcsL family acetyltransferase involved in cellulose biosynthesis
VGFVLHTLAIRDALATGAREYRLLRGGEPYKLRLADADRGAETVAVARGARGRAAVRLLGAEHALPRRLRLALPAAVAWGSGAAPLRGGA